MNRIKHKCGDEEILNCGACQTSSGIAAYLEVRYGSEPDDTQPVILYESDLLALLDMIGQHIN